MTRRLYNTTSTCHTLATDIQNFPWRTFMCVCMLCKRRIVETLLCCLWSMEPSLSSWPQTLNCHRSKQVASLLLGLVVTRCLPQPFSKHVSLLNPPPHLLEFTLLLSLLSLKSFSKVGFQASVSPAHCSQSRVGFGSRLQVHSNVPLSSQHSHTHQQDVKHIPYLILCPYAPCCLDPS